MINGACMAMGIEICYSLCFFFLFSIINKDKIKKKKKGRNISTSILNKSSEYSLVGAHAERVQQAAIKD